MHCLLHNISLVLNKIVMPTKCKKIFQDQQKDVCTSETKGCRYNTAQLIGHQYMYMY